MRLWLTSDQHFDHAKMVTAFTLADGSPARVFPSVEAMNERMVDEWNSVVRPQDHVYCLGDIAIQRGGLRFVSRLNGHKRLVRGNHDIFKTKDYLNAGFKEIHGVRVLDNVICTHVPIHPLSLGRFRGNAHGHTHHTVIPGCYVNLCVEVTDYRPVLLEAVSARLEALKATEIEGVAV